MSSCAHGHSHSSRPIVKASMTAEHDAATSGYPKLNFEPHGQRIRNIYLDRINQFTASGQYEGKNLRSVIDHDREDDPATVELSVYSVSHLERPLFEQVMKHAEFKPSRKGNSFGPSWSTHWFKIKLTVPERFYKYDHLEFHWDANCEGLVYTKDGEPVQGLTGGGERVEYIFPKSWKDGEPHLFYIEIACNGMFGNAPGGDSIQPPKPDRYFQLSMADLVAPNLEVRGLHDDYSIIRDAARELPSDSWESRYALQVANEIMNAFEEGNQDNIIACRKVAEKCLGHQVNSPDVYKTDGKPIVFATGHCHIDCCWLWPFAETKRLLTFSGFFAPADGMIGKVARSWASQCELMDRYPEHRFTASSALQYHWLETEYPKLFGRVKENVHKGKFQYIGGSWVEHDTNMPSGESLTRQFLVGQRYFESRFGARCNTFWLPDTFGYSAQLPQLCRLTGMTRFLTQKLSWNNINKFPHTTFNWVALDGSQVLCHMPPSETYNSEANLSDLKRSISQHKSLDDDHSSLLVFGKGDGGGGPTAEHIEKLRRCRGFSDKVGLLPRVHIGGSVDDWFGRIEDKIAKGQKFATWYGELYFELHRGTYTTQAKNKKYNRKAEMLMRDIETLATYASLAANYEYKYPNKDFEELWHIICQCQFHDCLPGSSIGMAYEESDKLYAELFERGKSIMQKALEVFGVSMQPNPQLEPIAINTSPWERTEIVMLPTAETSPENPYTILGAPKGPGIMKPCELHSSTVLAAETKPGIFVLVNSKIRAIIEGGHVTSLVDLHLNRELIPQGKRANQLVIMDDKPLYWQAWDVEVYHIESRKEIPAGKVTIVEKGPYRAALQVETKISEKSWIKTTIILNAAVNGATGTYLEFENEVEWRESMKFLKVEFPVDIYNAEASYETQYGIIRRPTHYNTSWDMAKFEVCCHKWADLSEHGYGVSILNDCKYGFATVGNLMRLSLLRAPKAPDANADMGRHHFRYAILPHKGGVSGEIVRIARDFNHQVVFGYVPKDKLDSVSKLLSTVTVEGDPSIILDTVKRGEDDEDVSTGGLPVRNGRSVILRLYESVGGKYSCTIKISLPVQAVYKTNLLEDDMEQVAFTQDSSNTVLINITLRPFEVATYRIQL